MKRYLAFGLAVIMMLSLLAGCSGGSGSSGAEGSESEESADSKDLKEITFVLDWTPNTNHTGIYVAQEKGYYEDAGLKVNIVQPPEDGAVSLVAAGQAQFGVDAQDTLAAALALDEPLHVKAVASLIQHNSSGIMSRKGEGMDKAGGLEGKTYSTWNSPIELAMIKYLMEKDGADFDKLELIPNNITDEPAALEAKQTDAVWVFYGWSCINADLKGFDYDYLWFKDYGKEMDYYTPVLIANSDFLESDPDTAKAFMEATAKGYEDAIEDPEGAAQILIKGDTTGSLAGSEELVTASQKWMADQYKADVDRWGYIDPERWDAFYKWLTDNDLCENPLEAGTGFTNDYLQE
ncbi:MAG: ABC transporter substrate-binding protein [Mogibacterium sp.]|nr:ABC transporter substrate-binding protein [Mogibacterium sp.]